MIASYDRDRRSFLKGDRDRDRDLKFVQDRDLDRDLNFPGQDWQKFAYLIQNHINVQLYVFQKKLFK